MRKVLLPLLLAFFLPLYAQDALPAPAPEEMRALSSVIRDKLTNLRTESLITNELLIELQNSLTQTSEELRLSESERKELETQREKLSVSLTSIQQQLNGSLDTIIVYEYRLKKQARLLLILTGILVTRILAMLAGFFLYAKGVRLPRWLDILL